MALLLVKMMLWRANEAQRDESGMATAELLGNAALGIGALVVIWALLRQLGVDVVTWMGDQIGVS